MHFGTREELELLALLVSVGAVLALSPTLRLPLPILLVLGGVVLSFIPGLPHVALPPDVVLVAVLPPLLYSGAFFTSLRDLRTNKRAISFLAFGLVSATMAAVAVVARSEEHTSELQSRGHLVCRLLLEKKKKKKKLQVYVYLKQFFFYY